MDKEEHSVYKSNVLLDYDNLAKAAMNTTQGGKKELRGLYLPAGTRVEMSSGQRHEENEVANEEAQRQINMAKVAKLYMTDQHYELRKADKKKQTDEEYFDEVSAKRAAPIMDAAGDHEMMQYRELFNFFDVDKDRTWGSIEFAQRMTDIGLSTSVETASNLLYFAGVRDVDRITFEDFIQMMPKLKAFRRLLEKDAMSSFQRYDTSRKGVIAIEDLPRVLRELAGPEGIGELQIKQFIKNADRERTGQIPFDFFIRAMFGTPPLVAYKPPPRGNPLLMLAKMLCPAKGSGANEDYKG
jgi:Ca2+-binding EF-hand superfamily protein